MALKKPKLRLDDPARRAHHKGAAKPSPAPAQAAASTPAKAAHKIPLEPIGTRPRTSTAAQSATSRPRAPMAAAATQTRAPAVPNAKRTTRHFMAVAAIGAAVAVALSAVASLMSTSKPENRTVIYKEEVRRPVVKDQSRLPPAGELEGVNRVPAFSFIINSATGETCTITATKTADDCRAEVGLPVAGKHLPLTEIDQAERARLAALDAERIRIEAAAKEAERIRLQAEADRIEQARLAALKTQAAAVIRPTHVAFKDALQPDSLFPVKGLTVPDGKGTRVISLAARHKMSAATMKAEGLRLDSVLAWHGDRPITVESALRHMNIWRLPRVEDLPHFKACLEQFGFNPIPLADLTHIEKKYGLPSGIMAAIYQRESGGYQCTESWTHARGPLQVMRITQDHMISEYGLPKGNMYALAEAAEVTGSWLAHYKHAYNIGRFQAARQREILMAFYVQGPRDVAPNIQSDGTLLVANLTCAAKDYVPGSKQSCRGRSGTPETAVADAAGPDLGDILFGWLKPKAAPAKGRQEAPVLTFGN